MRQLRALWRFADGDPTVPPLGRSLRIQAARLAVIALVAALALLFVVIVALLLLAFMPLP